jgi:hypothetical protein
MSLPRMLLIVAIGGLLGAVLVWGALSLVYGPEAAFALRVLFSAAVAGVVHWRVKATGETGHGEPVEHAAEAAEAGNRQWPELHHWVEPDPVAVVAADVDRGTYANGPDVEPITVERIREVADEASREVAAATATIGGVPFAGFSSVKLGGVTWPADSLAARHEARTVDAFAPGRGSFSASFKVPAAEAAAFADELRALLPATPTLALTVRGWNRRGEEVTETIAVESLTCGMLAGDPFAGAVYPSGGHGKRGKKRPGQWGWRARMLRARRLDRAWVARTTARDERQCQRAGRINRAARRAAERLGLEAQARANYGIEPLPGESTAALRDRVLRVRCRELASRGRPTLADIAALSGGVVEVDNATATVRITMPVGTSAERCEEVRVQVSDRVPVPVAVEVVCATS